MNRRQFLKALGLAGVAGTVSLQSCSTSGPVNVVWITAEDLCPELGCYGNELVHTPHIDRLASEGMRFTNVFSTAPVCSASRSAFMTGMYQTTIGAHNHRSHRDDGYRLPQGVSLITDYFRAAGYFTCNVTRVNDEVKGSGKTDFNFAVDHPFDGDDWSQRQSGQPFFAHINFPETHRTFERDLEHPTDPEKVSPPPYYPDHPLVRMDWALYYDTMNHLDRKVGAVLQRLDEEGLSDNTLVLFFADHGRPHVRGKQWLYDGGIHIPLIVRWPGHVDPGTVNDQLVSAIDITATSLALAGISVPEAMQGRPFLGRNTQPREVIFAARDRCDETVDRIRCVRSKRFKYIRNFHPDRPYLQLNRYKEKQYPVLRLMRKLHLEQKLAPEQALFMAPRRPKEELYDLESDPHEINNLANDPDFQPRLTDMRTQLDAWIKASRDQGEIPEDPAIAGQYKAKMQELYDKDIRRFYQQEGLEPELIGL